MKNKAKITGVTKKEVAYELWRRDPKVNRSQVSKCLGVNIRTIQNYFGEFRALDEGQEPVFGRSGTRMPLETARKILHDPDSFQKERADPTADVLTDEELKEDLEDVKIEATINPDKKSSTTVFGKTLDESPSSSDVIRTAVEKAGIDPECWDIGQCKVNFWHTSMKVRMPDKRNKNGYLHRVVRVTNWSVKITLLPNRQPFVHNAVRELVDRFMPLAPIKLPPQERGGRYAGVLSPVDMHFGKAAWNNETMQGHMDLKIAKRVFVESCSENLRDMSRYPLSKIYFIVGHDLMHFENYNAETFRGRHHLDVDSRLPKTIRVTKEAIIQVADMAAQVAPVEILRVPGNHDMHASYWLVELMRERYRKNRHIVVDNGVYSDSPRKLIKWGDLIVGLTHDASAGKMLRAVNMLPQFWPKEWGESRYRELWVGHKHKKTDTRTYPTHTVGGTLIRQLSALTAIDFWHFDEMWVDAVPACESFVLDRTDGVVANFKRNIDYRGITLEEDRKKRPDKPAKFTLP